jgi:hypothetical protein
MKRVVFFVVVCVALISGQQAQASLITGLQSFSGGIPASSNLLFGWIFDVLTPIDVASLGVGDENSDGLTSSHDVGIFRQSDQSLLASATVPLGTTGTLDNGFRYTTLGSAVTLAPDRYVIVMTMQPNQDRQSLLNTSVTTAPEIGYVTSAVGVGAGLLFPTPAGNGAFAEGIFGPNFQFQAVAVPEPGSLAMLGLGVVGFGAYRRRKAMKDSAV